MVDLLYYIITENCNYAICTMKTLLARHGYEIKQFYWYNGRARFAEGLIIVTE